MAAALPEHLVYEENGTKEPLPEWVRYYAELGRIAVLNNARDRRLVIAVAVPTRAYCAAFAAVGAVTTNAATDGVFVESWSHFDQLCQLPIGTAVFFRKNNRKLKGIYEGKDSDSSQKPFVRIRIHNRAAGGLTRLVYPEHAHKVEVANNAQPEPELPKQQKGRHLTTSIEFADQFYEHSLEAVALKSRVLCAIVGRANALVREIKGTQFAVQTGDSECEIRGTLQDVVRIRTFGGEAEHFLTEVLPSDRVPADKLEDVPPVVIFDGACGFLSRRDDWHQSNWIVIIDRTESHFQSAVDILNQDFVKRRLHDSTVDSQFDGLPPAPPGVELFAYEEASKCGS